MAKTLNLPKLFYRFVSVDNLSESHESLWREALGNVRKASVFHSVEWSQLLFAEFGAITKVAIALVQNQPVGLYCFNWVEDWHVFRKCRSRFGEFESPYGGPLAKSGFEWVVPLLLGNVQALGRVTICDVVTVPLFEAQWLRAAGFSFNCLYTSIVKLDRSEDDLWTGVHGKTRNMIRKAQSRGVEIRQADEMGVELYYPMLKEVLGRHGKSPLPESYYRRVVAGLSPKGMARFTLAWHKGCAIAGLVALCFRDTVYYWSGASYSDERSVAPNELLQWDLMCWANANGYKFYDLLRVEPDALPGIARFKMRFGGELAELYSGMHRSPLGQIVRAFQFIADPRRIARRLQRSVGGLLFRGNRVILRGP